MPKTKYKSDYNSELQDPEAIFTADSVIGEDIMAFNSSSNKAKSSGILKQTYENEDSNTESKTIITHEPTLLHSKAQTLSEPDLNQALLYDMPQEWTSPVDKNKEERGQRKTSRKAGTSPTI